MNQERMGLLIKKMRKEKNMTQLQLASMIPISREAVSKWERGKTLPDYDVIIKLSEIFNIAIDELLSGELKNNNDSKINLKTFQNKIKKKIIKSIFWKIGFIILIIFLSYCFFRQYYLTDIYKIYFHNENLTIENGNVIVTSKKVYFNLGTIDSNKKIKNLKLYYIDKNQREKLILSTNNKNISFTDSLGYEEYFDFADIEGCLNNFFIKIVYDDYTEVVKINLEKLPTSSTNLFQKLMDLISPLIFKNF